MSKEDNQKSGEKRGNIAQLLDFAGNRKILTYIGCAPVSYTHLRSPRD